MFPSIKIKIMHKLIIKYPKKNASMSRHSPRGRPMTPRTSLVADINWQLCLSSAGPMKNVYSRFRIIMELGVVEEG